MAEQNPSTQPEEKAVEASLRLNPTTTPLKAHTHTPASEKKQAIKEALKLPGTPKIRR